MLLACSSLPSQDNGLDAGGSQTASWSPSIDFESATVWAAIKYLLLTDLGRWTPDEGGLLKQEPLRSMTCGVARQRFGVAPQMLSCWLCLAATLDDELSQRALPMDDSTFWGPVLHYYKCDQQNDDSFPPGVHVIVEQSLSEKPKSTQRHQAAQRP